MYLILFRTPLFSTWKGRVGLDFPVGMSWTPDSQRHSRDNSSSTSTIWQKTQSFPSQRPCEISTQPDIFVLQRLSAWNLSQLSRSDIFLKFTCYFSRPLADITPCRGLNIQNDKILNVALARLDLRFCPYSFRLRVITCRKGHGSMYPWSPILTVIWGSHCNSNNDDGRRYSL